MNDFSKYLVRVYSQCRLEINYSLVNISIKHLKNLGSWNTSNAFTFTLTSLWPFSFSMFIELNMSTSKKGILSSASKSYKQWLYIIKQLFYTYWLLRRVIRGYLRYMYYLKTYYRAYTLNESLPSIFLRYMFFTLTLVRSSFSPEKVS